jgi:hypothetical protein
MAKAKELLNARFYILKGKAYESIVNYVTEGEIKPNASYIQTFNSIDFSPPSPDVTFMTTANEVCYLYKVD